MGAVKLVSSLITLDSCFSSSKVCTTISGLSVGRTLFPVGKPVAMIVQVILLPSSFWPPIPIITLAFPPASR